MEDFEPIVDDLRAVVRDARRDLPVVMVGHSMGGLIATRYAQRHREDLAGLVLSGPAVGLAPVFEEWLAAPELPSDPIDVATLSREPAVGEAYASDPRVYHDGWKRPTLEAFVAADRAIAQGPGFGLVPTFAERVTAGRTARAGRPPRGDPEKGASRTAAYATLQRIAGELTSMNAG